MSSFLSSLEWRRAIKGFETGRTVGETDLKKILHAVQMAPTSFGLQPFEVHVVKNLELREKMRAQAWNQAQLTTASAVLVFVARNDLKERISELLQKLSGGNPQALEGLKVYEGMMRGMLESRTDEERMAWSAKQAYIALGFALSACAELRIDSCPMEGFNPQEFDKLLGLSASRTSVVILPIGYRDEALPLMPQFRFPESDLFHEKR